VHNTAFCQQQYITLNISEIFVDDITYVMSFMIGLNSDSELLCAYVAIGDWCLSLPNNGHCCNISKIPRFIVFRCHVTLLPS
jgi:hypothetical protein